MTKDKVKIISTIIFMLILLFIPSYSNAEYAELQYVDINKTSTLSVDDFYFYSVKYINHPKVFGLAGTVMNNGTEDKNFSATTFFYNKDYDLVTTLEENQFVPAGEVNSFSSALSPSAITSEYSANDICYYSLVVRTETTEDTYNYNYYPDYNYSSGYYDYIIDNYDINMVVNENNTFDITEKITATFKIPKHGIFRKIPLKNNIERLDGTKSKNRAEIRNISVDNQYSTYNEGGYKIIKIGDPYTTLTGSHTYTIKYTYNIGKDPVKNADELYFNLIGNEWDTEIKNISFSITMPKEFDSSLLGFSSGPKGSSDSSNVEYEVKGNTITGNTKNTLSPGEGLTVRLTLPDEYFVGAGLITDNIPMIFTIICIFAIFISYRIWAKYGKDDEVIETIEFYPPKGYNSAEIAFLYNGYSNNEGVVSLLLYLADKGYLQIEEAPSRFILTKSKRI